MGHVALQRDDRLDHAALVDDDLRLVQIEIDRPAAPPRVVQDLKQLAHLLEHRHQRRVLRQQCGIAIRQDAVDGGVGHALVAVDDAVVKFVADHLAVPIDFHQTGLHQPIDVRIEAAETGGELRRKHVDRALGEIHGRAAVVGFAIERAAVVHVVRDVRDVHAEPEVAVRQPLDRDRIVEIARVLAVDRHRGHAAEVGAPADVLFRDGGSQPDRLGDRVG